MSEQATAEHSAKDPSAPATYGPAVKLQAWLVHFYTSLGLVLAGCIVALLVRGDHDAFWWSFVLMIVATLVDATDGTMARRVGVKKVLPNFDGRKLDDITDFLTYTFLPLFLIWRAGILPESLAPWLFLPLLASAYGFCQVDVKTDDGYFLGFPSLWNVVAFYIYALHPPVAVSLGALIVLGLMTFVPSRYLYPSSQPGRLNWWSNVLSVVWVVVLAAVLWSMPAGKDPSTSTLAWTLAMVSLFYPIFYMGASWIVTVRHWLQHRAA